MISNDCRCPGCGTCDAASEVSDLRKSLREWKQKHAELSRMNTSYIKHLHAAERERDDLKAKLDAELPAAWREDVESLNGCLERASRDLYEARSEIDHHKRVVLMLEAKCEEATRERDEAQGKVERIRRDFVQLQERVEAAGSLISQVGCDCPCDHDAESHDEHCERCIQCLLCGILWPRVSK